MLCYKICCLLYCWPVALTTISATKCKGKHLPTPPPGPESSEGCVWRKMMRNGELAEKNEHRVTQVPWPKGCPQKETHLISITQRWQQLATLPLHLPRHHFVILGQTWTLSSRGDTGRWCINQKMAHSHISVYNATKRSCTGYFYCIDWYCVIWLWEQVYFSHLKGKGRG